MSTTENENAPYTGWSVAELERARAVNRINLNAHRDIRKKIKAELEIAKAREANNPKPIPENPGWGTFTFNARLSAGDRAKPFTCSQYGGKISVVSDGDYWFFHSWNEFIEWLRDTEQVPGVSHIWKLTEATAPMVNAR